MESEHNIRKKQKLASVPVHGDIRKEFQKCIKLGELPKAFEIFQRLSKLQGESCVLDIFFYHGILRLCSTARMEDPLKKKYAYQVFDLLENFGWTFYSSLTSETTFSSLICICSKIEDIEQGFHYVELMETLKIVPRLRTYSSLLAVAARLNNTAAAFRLYDLTITHSIHLTEKEFLSLLQLCLHTGDSSNFYNVLSRYMVEITAPSRLCWGILRRWFSAECDFEPPNEAIWKCDVGKVSADGICLISGAQLQPLLLSVDYRIKLLKQIDSLVCTNPKRCEQWNLFKSWLQLNASDGFDIVVDAANVGFCASGGSRSSFDFSQVKNVVSHFENKGKRVLVVLHEMRAKNLNESLLLEKWRLQGTLYCCLTGNNDDWYWLYAAVWSKKNALIVSNDLLRDHNYLMMRDHNKFFENWKTSRQVFFAINCIKGVKRLVFEEPCKYSRRIQKLKESWHFPDQDSEEWLCVHKNI